MSQFNQYGLLLLVFSCSKIFELRITRISTILNLYWKTGILFCLDGRIMLTIINLTKISIRRDNVEAVYFLHLKD